MYIYRIVQHEKCRLIVSLGFINHNMMAYGVQRSEAPYILNLRGEWSAYTQATYPHRKVHVPTGKETKHGGKIT
jgi:hypothetical protein